LWLAAAAYRQIDVHERVSPPPEKDNTPVTTSLITQMQNKLRKRDLHSHNTTISD